MFQLMLSGFALGCIYSLVALGYHITFITSKSLNFAQGSAMMLGAVSLMLLTEDLGLPIPIGIVGALVVLAAFGVALERLAVRPFVRRNSVGWVLATIAVGIMVENLVQIVFGKSPRGMASAMVQDPVVIFGAGIYPLELLIPVVVLAIAVVARLAYSGTMVGRALRATAFDREAALAMGINVNRMVALSYALSSILAAVGGILLAPLVGVSSHMGFLIGLKAFAVAIVAGLGNPVGILVVGILYGIMENLVGGMFGSSAKEIAGFGLVILVLFVHPVGLFSGATLRRV